MDSKQYFLDKYNQELDKIHDLDNQIDLLKRRRQVCQNNAEKYHKSYLKLVTNKVIVDNKKEKPKKIKNKQQIIEESFEAIQTLKEENKSLKRKNYRLNIKLKDLKNSKKELENINHNLNSKNKEITDKYLKLFNEYNRVVDIGLNRHKSKAKPNNIFKKILEEV